MNRVALSAIAFDAGTQVRASLDTATVNDYAEAMTNGAIFPAVTLFHDGSVYYLADGFHRYMAAQRIGLTDIIADVQPGTREDAFRAGLHALKTAGTGALRPKRADIKHAVLRALELWPDMSSSAISEMVGCTDAYVGRIRNEVHTSMNLPNYGTRVTGKDGKQYPASRNSRTTSAPAADTESFKSRQSVKARHERIRALAAEGLTASQIARDVGMGPEGVRVAAKKLGVTIIADKVVGRSRHLDSNRIVAIMAEQAEHLVSDAHLIAFGELQRHSVADWIASFKVAHRALGAFIRRLEKETA